MTKLRSSPRVIELPKMFQGGCWHCQPGYFDFRPKVERRGLRCNHCAKLNEYRWTQAQYEETARDYNQSRRSAGSPARCRLSGRDSGCLPPSRGLIPPAWN